VTIAVVAVVKMKRASTSSSPLEAARAAPAATSWSATAEVTTAAVLFLIRTATLMRQSEAAARASAPTMLADATLTPMAARLTLLSDAQVPLQRAFDLDLSDETLELRRLRADLLVCYTILHHFVDIPQYFFNISDVNKTRGNSFKLNMTSSRVDARANFFAARIINIWNRPSDEIVNASSIYLFTIKWLKPIYLLLQLENISILYVCYHYLLIFL